MTDAKPEGTDQIAAALSAAQASYKEAKKSKRGNYGQYADRADCWEAARAALKANGLAVFQGFVDEGPVVTDGLAWCVLETRVLHASGQELRSVLRKPYAVNMPIQQFKGMTTYMLRIGFNAATGITDGEDDDGQVAQDWGKARKKRPQPFKP